MLKLHVTACKIGETSTVTFFIILLNYTYYIQHVQYKTITLLYNNI